MTSLINEADTTSIVHSANSIDEATGMLTKNPDLILLDINLPGKNGITLLKHITESSPNCKVIMMSNYTEEYYQERCRKLGAALFLDKTNDFELIPGIVKELNN